MSFRFSLLIIVCLAGCQAEPIRYEILEVKSEGYSTAAEVRRVIRHRGIGQVCRYANGEKVNEPAN